MLRILSAVAAVSVVAALAAPAQAQAHDNRGYGYSYAPSVWAQRDRPGDYRCDAYWDAGRTDCHEAWRDQRPYRANYGYGRGYGYRHGHDYNRYAHAVGAGDAWNGAYGRPDLVYPGAGPGAGRAYGYGAGQGARDPRRIDWCRWNYRSYDPASGYYRAYSGRLVYCG